jgi:hypothetical protein
MRKLIELEKEKRKIICDAKGVTDSNLSQALRFTRNSENAIAMRVMAMENGGVFYKEDKEWDKKELKY